MIKPHKLLVELQVASSTSEAVRLLRQRAVRIGGTPLDPRREIKIEPAKPLELSVGPARHYRVVGSWVRNHWEDGKRLLSTFVIQEGVTFRILWRGPGQEIPASAIGTFSSLQEAKREADRLAASKLPPRHACSGCEPWTEEVVVQQP